MGRTLRRTGDQRLQGNARYTYVFAYVCACVRVYIYIYLCMYICSYVRIGLYTYMYKSPGTRGHSVGSADFVISSRSGPHIQHRCFMVLGSTTLDSSGDESFWQECWTSEGTR